LVYFCMKGSTKWYLQRFTSLTLVPISYWFVIFFLNNLNLSSENFVNSLDSNFVKLLIIIFFCVAVFHTRLNLLTIYEDYFNDNQVRLYSRLTDSVLLLILLFILPIIFI
jgi:succinate dehydrogenase hydrophobic membrane anchor protein